LISKQRREKLDKETDRIMLIAGIKGIGIGAVIVVLALALSWTMVYAQEPNIALEQAKYFEMKNVTTIANPFDLTLEEINSLSFEEAISHADEMVELGKQFYTDCNELTGLCSYGWKNPADLVFEVTSEFGNKTRQVGLYCGEGTFTNYTSMTCEPTEEAIAELRRDTVLLSLIGGILSITILIFAVRKITKAKKKFDGFDAS
jgi:hypothetical protein